MTPDRVPVAPTDSDYEGCSLDDVRVGQPFAPYHAACRCGWWGPARDIVSRAIRDAREHAGGVPVTRPEGVTVDDALDRLEANLPLGGVLREDIATVRDALQQARDERDEHLTMARSWKNSAEAARNDFETEYARAAALREAIATLDHQVEAAEAEVQRLTHLSEAKSEDIAMMEQDMRGVSP